MISYGAYSRVTDEFSSLDEAAGSLDRFPWTAGRVITAVSVVTQENSFGIHGELVSGSPTTVVSSAQAYVVTVTHEALGRVFDVQYIIEFGEESSDGEDAGHEDDGRIEPGDEETPEESDDGLEQGGEGNGDLPPGDPDERYAHD